MASLAETSLSTARSLYIGRDLSEAVTDARMIANEAEEKSRI
jgi:hypothetical protein